MNKLLSVKPVLGDWQSYRLCRKEDPPPHFGGVQSFC